MILTTLLQCKPRSLKLRQIDPSRRHSSMTSYRAFKEQLIRFGRLDLTGLLLRLPSQYLLNVQYQNLPFAAKLKTLPFMRQFHNVGSALAFLIVKPRPPSPRRLPLSLAQRSSGRSKPISKSMSTPTRLLLLFPLLL